jgi:hypothetical protein
MAAVPGSDIAGPDCAPNQASAALSRSLVNQRSSRVSPEPRKSTASSPPGVRGCPPDGAPIGQKERIRPAAPGRRPNAATTARLRGPQTSTNRR